MQIFVLLIFAGNWKYFRAFNSHECLWSSWWVDWGSLQLILKERVGYMFHKYLQSGCRVVSQSTKNGNEIITVRSVESYSIVIHPNSCNPSFNLWVLLTSTLVDCTRWTKPKVWKDATVSWHSLEPIFWDAHGIILECLSWKGKYHQRRLS